MRAGLLAPGRHLATLLVVLFVLTACAGFGLTVPLTPAEQLAGLEISSEEIDKRIIDLVDTGILKGDTARRVDTAMKAFDATIDTARVTMRQGGNMDPAVASVKAALAAVIAILETLQKKGAG